MASMKITKPKSITKTVLEVFDHMKVGEEYSGYDLKRWVTKKNPACEYVYIETYLKILRMKRRSQFICINHAKSIYRKIEGAK